MRQAIILAAGKGSRLGENLPKCLVEIAGVPLIERQLAVLHEVGIDRICMVVGHQADEVRATVGDRCDFVVNQHYSETNSLYSLWLARDWVRGSCILMNCDVLAHPDIYHRVLAANGSALAYDSSSGDDEEHMKVSLHGSYVHRMGKAMPAGIVDGENVGVIQFASRDVEMLFQECDRLVQDGGAGRWAPAAVDRLARRTDVRAVDVRDLPWTEIDFPQDLREAHDRTLPLINYGRWSTTTRPTARPLLFHPAPPAEAG